MRPGSWSNCHLDELQSPANGYSKSNMMKNGKIDRFKGGLVAKGFLQKYGIEFDETFSPVVRFTHIRALLAFAVSRNMFIHQMDVVTVSVLTKISIWSSRKVMLFREKKLLYAI